MKAKWSSWQVKVFRGLTRLLDVGIASTCGIIVSRHSCWKPGGGIKREMKGGSTLWHGIVPDVFSQELYETKFKTYVHLCWIFVICISRIIAVVKPLLRNIFCFGHKLETFVRLIYLYVFWEMLNAFEFSGLIWIFRTGHCDALPRRNTDGRRLNKLRLQMHFCHSTRSPQ